jgi:uncharacterized protein (TIGR03067 family)
MTAAPAVENEPEESPMPDDDDRRAGDAERELQRFEGTWELAAWLAEGKETSLPGGAKVVSVIRGGQVTETAGDQVQESVLRVDPSAEPRAVDCTMVSGKNAGVTYLGIYEFRGDELRLCYALAGRPRPTGFSSEPGSGHYLAAFRRLRP